MTDAETMPCTCWCHRTMAHAERCKPGRCEPHGKDVYSNSNGPMAQKGQHAEEESAPQQ